MNADEEIEPEEAHTLAISRTESLPIHRRRRQLTELHERTNASSGLLPIVSPSPAPSTPPSPGNSNNKKRVPLGMAPLTRHDDRGASVQQVQMLRQMAANLREDSSPPPSPTWDSRSPTRERAFSEAVSRVRRLSLKVGSDTRSRSSTVHTPDQSPQSTPLRSGDVTDSEDSTTITGAGGRYTAADYSSIKQGIYDKYWKSPGELYELATRIIDEGGDLCEEQGTFFPKWNALHRGLDPKYPQAANGECSVDPVRNTLNRQVLQIDSVGFEAEYYTWTKRTAVATIMEIQENLTVPSNFTRYSTKFRPRTVEMSLDTGGLHILCHFVDTGKVTRIPLSQISGLRLGPKTKGFEAGRSPGDKMEERFAFTIIYGRDLQEIDLLGRYEHKVQLWFCGLIRLVTDTRNDTDEANYLSRCWDSVGKPALTSKEILELLSTMKIKASSKRVKDILNATRLENPRAQKDQYTLEDFTKVIRALRARDEIREIFERYSNGEDLLYLPQVMRFLREEQHDTENTASTKALYQFLGPFREREEDRHLTLNQFSSLITSLEHNSVFNPHMQGIYQDMTRPLTDYYCNSSHNTYLEGNQLNGWSSSDMYMRLLKAGVRCVELDTWNGEKGDPIIYHGHTLTSRINFEDVVRAIRDYAFVSSDYPVILSLENHCSVEQQCRMAEIFIEYLKDSIARPIVGSDRTHLPSPEDLKGKIIIKGKVDRLNMNMYGDQEVKVSVAPELAAITYLTSVPFTSYEAYVEKSKGPWQISSFVETRIEGLPPTEFVEYNRKNYSRVYPKGSRTMSSNYNPELWWTVGSQLVALNLQTMGRATWTNEGRFRENGNCGYTLKPFYMLHDWHEPFSEHTTPPYYPIRLSVDVLSARQLPTSRKHKTDTINPFVSVFVRGATVDCASDSTHKIKGNGFNPSWNKHMEFDIQYPEMAVLLIVIYHEPEGLKSFLSGATGNRVKIAYYSLPVGCIRQGYRMMELYNEKGMRNPMSDLFCRFTVESLCSTENTVLHVDQANVIY